VPTIREVAGAVLSGIVLAALTLILFAII